MTRSDQRDPPGSSTGPAANSTEPAANSTESTARTSDLAPQTHPAPQLIPAAPHPEAIVVIGGSAGSLPPLVELVAGLPADLPAAVLVVVHRGDRASSQLAEILSRAGRLPATMAQDGEPVRAGHIYVAPPRRHLITSSGWTRLGNGPRVNRHRPAIDLLFASTVQWSRRRTVAVVLSGVLDDGAVGTALISRSGGRVLVEDPAEATFAGMPAAALAAAPGAHAVPADHLARCVLEQLTELRDSPDLPSLHISGRETEMGMADSDDPGYLAEDETKLTRMVCPECGGSLAQVDLPRITYFRCHTGHQYAPQTLAAAQADTAEAKLWSAVAALEEQAALLRYLADLPTRPAETPSPAESADEVARRAAVLRKHVQQWATPLPGQPD